MILKTYGNSMLPFFKDGDQTIIDPIKISKVQIDDFITYINKPIHYITHRVIYIHPRKKFIITKGDNNYTPDKKVLPNQIIGIVNAIKRKKKIYTIKEFYFRQSSIYYREVIQVKNSFFKNKITFLFLKGLPLHLLVEKKIPFRIYADCDILVDSKQYESIDTELKKLGYICVSDDLSPINKKDKKFYEIQYIKQVNGVTVTLDIHFQAVFLMTQITNLTSLYPNKELTRFTSLLLQNKKNVTFQNEVFPMLKIDYLVIYLMLHLFHHNYQGYYRYEIIKKVICSHKINMSNLIIIIHNFKLASFIYPIFINLNRYYSMNLPVRNLKISERKKKYIEKHILTEDFLSDDYRIKAGIKRFKYIFYLSEEPFFKKIFVFLNPEVLIHIFFVLLQKIYSFHYDKYFFLKKLLN